MNSNNHQTEENKKKMSDQPSRTPKRNRDTEAACGSSTQTLVKKQRQTLQHAPAVVGKHITPKRTLSPDEREFIRFGSPRVVVWDSKRVEDLLAGGLGRQLRQCLDELLVRKLYWGHKSLGEVDPSSPFLAPLCSFGNVTARSCATFHTTDTTEGDYKFARISTPAFRVDSLLPLKQLFSALGDLHPGLKPFRAHVNKYPHQQLPKSKQQGALSWHSDDQTELTKNTPIITVSLGSSMLVRVKGVTEEGKKFKNVDIVTCDRHVYGMYGARMQKITQHGVFPLNRFTSIAKKASRRAGVVVHTPTQSNNVRYSITVRFLRQ